jgi:hypothetical protein
LIENWEDWERPKRDYQWKPGRSAMELAKSWFREGRLSPPDEFIALLMSEPRLQELRLLRGTPELVTALPERGEGRNHDLALIGQTPRESVTVCVEAKADEPFGAETVLEYWERAMRRQNLGESTRVPERIQALLRMIDRSGLLPGESAWGLVRYQLLAAICGTVRQAQLDCSSLAVFVVHEFHTESTLKENLRRNQLDLEEFLSVLSAGAMSLESGRLYGPFEITGVDCFVGKAVAESGEGLPN